MLLNTVNIPFCKQSKEVIANENISRLDLHCTVVISTKMDHRCQSTLLSMVPVGCLKHEFFTLSIMGRDQSLLAMIAHTAVQSSQRTQIHNAILFIDASTVLDSTMFIL